MILVDANLLIYAHNEAAAEHAAARAWFEDAMSGSDRVGLPLNSILAFVRIVSNPIIVRHPVTPAEAWQRSRGWLQRPNVWIPHPGPNHSEILTTLFADSRITSRMVPDAHLAALAIEHGLTLCSTDGDFKKFPALRWVNPLGA